MISQLTGRIASATSDEIILDVNGVGYQLFMSKAALGAMMGAVGQVTTLFIETHVREDHIHLFAFQTAEEKIWFKKLTNVSGVGARTAQAILSACPPQRLMGAIAAQDYKALTAAEGVGPKVAQRLVVELKDKLPAVSLTSAPVVQIAAAKNAPQPESNVVEDAVSALANLGYDRTLAHQICMRIAYANDNDMAFDALFKAALKELSV